ncbi:MAG: hypothetical protein AB7V13_20795 [Pseudorhodoplanes sp.]|uniref:hypothetical protein n=1 Tax=Pseudorhodoplanes sp. TaxID=1934341 RepID=UPI003D13B329
MKADDPCLEKARQEMIERIKSYDERMLTVIKCHLGCEDFLNGLPSAAGRRWTPHLRFSEARHIKRFDFSERGDVLGSQPFQLFGEHSAFEVDGARKCVV